MSKRPRLRNAQASHTFGQALVEFAIVLPVLALLLLGTIQLAFIFGTQIGVTNAVREAARLGSTTVPTLTPAQGTANANGVFTALTSSPSGYLPRNVWFYSPSNLVTSGTPRTTVCYRGDTDTAGKPAVFLKVEAQYRHNLFIPLIAPLLDGIDGTTGDGLRVGASEEIRVSNDEMLVQTMTSVACNT